MANCATVFVNTELYYAGQECFGVRFDNGELPRGSFVVGFFSLDEGELLYIIDEYYAGSDILTETQEEHLQRTIDFVRSVFDENKQGVWLELREGLL